MSSPMMKFLLVDTAQLVSGGEEDTHNYPHFSQEAEQQPKSLMENLAEKNTDIIVSRLDNIEKKLKP